MQKRLNVMDRTILSMGKRINEIIKRKGQRINTQTKDKQKAINLVTATMVSKVKVSRAVQLKDKNVAILILKAR